MADFSNMFKSVPNNSVFTTRKYPNAGSVVEKEISDLQHLLQMTSRLPSTKAAAGIIEQCIKKLEQVIQGENNKLEAQSSFSMK